MTSVASVEPAVDVDVICPTCSERRYTSIRPIGVKEKLSASLFKPVNDAPVMVDGQPLLCYMCNSLMRFSKSIGSSVPPSREELVAHRTRVEGDGSAQPAISAGTLFEVKQGEEVRDIRETPNSLVVITNKRIVRVII